MTILMVKLFKLMEDGNMVVREIDPKKDLIFNLKVNEACRSCKRYGLTGCCPPTIGDFPYYKQLLKQYNYGKIYILRFDIKKENDYKELGKKSSLNLHKILLDERQKLLNQGHYFNVLLGGGSCKLCTECSIPCKKPQFRAIPIEATGVDVIETLNKLGIFLKFPVKTHFFRVGLILWD